MSTPPPAPAPLAVVGRNPDVLTCIANLSSDEVFTPPEFANQMLDTLAEGWAASNAGANLWADSTATFLDPFTKSGVFLREITKRLVDGLADEITDLDERVDHILTKQVYGIGITELTALLARRTVYCSKWAVRTKAHPHSIAETFTRDWGNIWFERTDHTWEGGTNWVLTADENGNQVNRVTNGRCKFCGAPQLIFGAANRSGMETHAYAFLHTDDPAARMAELFGADMKFDVIIGNPPYQMTGGGGGSNDSSIYHLFVEQAQRLEPRFLSMVVPSRWMAGGRGMDEFRKAMLGDRHLRTMVDYPNSSEVFPGVDLKSGICFFLWDRKYDGDCLVTLVRDRDVVGPSLRKLNEYDVLVRDERAASILKKVVGKGETSFEELLTGDTPFGLASNFSGFRPGEPKVDEIKVYASSNGTRRVGAMPRALITKNTHLIDSWKVLAPKAGPGNSGGHILPDMVLGRPSIAEPNSVCTQTWLVAGPFSAEAQAEVVARYLQTRFVRFLVSLRKISQDAMRGVYRWVPQQVWDRTWNDQQLYARYDITDEEIAFIESIIRPMEAPEAPTDA